MDGVQHGGRVHLLRVTVGWFVEFPDPVQQAVQILEDHRVREQLPVVFVKLDLIEPQADEREVQGVLPVHPAKHGGSRLRVGHVFQILEDGDEKEQWDGDVRLRGVPEGLGFAVFAQLAELVPHVPVEGALLEEGFAGGSRVLGNGPDSLRTHGHCSSSRHLARGRGWTGHRFEHLQSNLPPS